MLAATAVFTGLLFWIAWLAYEKLLVQEARKKQLEIVVQLVEKLKGINLNWAKITMENGEPKMSSLEIQSIFSMPMNSRPENNYKMFVHAWDDSFVWLQDFSHPLMPVELVDTWRRFVGAITPRPYYSSTNAPDSFYCVLKNPANVSNETLKSYFEINNGTDEFFDGILEVRNSITRWFRRNGINELNTRVIW